MAENSEQYSGINAGRKARAAQRRREQRNSQNQQNVAERRQAYLNSIPSDVPF